MSTNLTRRQMLGRLLLGGGALVLPGGGMLACRRQALVGPSERRTDHYFVFYYLMGGWDITTTTDPLDPGPNRDLAYTPDEIVHAGPHRFGPNMAPVREWFDRMAVVRGVRAQALNHPQARFQLVTGQFKEPGEEPAASVQTRIAQQRGEAYALPSLSSDGMRPSVFLGDAHPHVKPLRFRDVGQLHQLMHVEGATSAYEDHIQAAIQKRDGLRQRRYADALSGQFHTYAELAREVRGSDLQKRVDPTRSVDIETTVRVRQNNRWGRQARLAVEVVRQDLAPVISVGSGEFDAHNKNAYSTHHLAVKRGMETVAAILGGLESVADPVLGGTLLDHTTVVVSSEFSREPWINELGGKHHWATNAVLLFGKGIKRNDDGSPVVFGETDDLLYSQPIDPATGSTTSRNADDLLITNVNATLLQLAGLDGERLMEAAPIPSILA